MIDYITTEGKLVMSAEDDCCGIHLKGDVITFSDGSTYVVAQRTWHYSESGISILNPRDPSKCTSGVKAQLQIVLQEVSVNAGPQLLS